MAPVGKVLGVCLALLILDLAAAQQCLTPEKRFGDCVLLRTCDSLFTRIQQKPLPESDRQYLSKTQCGWSAADNHPLVCCPDAQEAPLRVGMSLLPTPGICGIQTSDRIVGGVNTKIDEYPWLALLKYAKPNNEFGFHCGGALINDRYVLTASHCVNSKAIPVTWNLAEVRLGEWDTSTAQDCVGTGSDIDCAPQPMDIAIEQKIPHLDYQSESRAQYNDIALLRLQQRVEFSDFVKPICLPVAEQFQAKSYTGLKLQVAGWGRTSTGRFSNIKQKVGVDFVDLATCNTVYQREAVVLNDTQLCAGGESGKDSCQGDSGGPLMGVEKTGTVQYWYLVGLVSFGPTPCGQLGFPGVYTKIDRYTNWILSNIVA